MATSSGDDDAAGSSMETVVDNSGSKAEIEVSGVGPISAFEWASELLAIGLWSGDGLLDQK